MTLIRKLKEIGEMASKITPYTLEIGLLNFPFALFSRVSIKEKITGSI